MKRVLVTGATGFIGRALLPVLVAHGFEVHGVARGAQPATPGVTWHTADLLTEAGRAYALAAARPTHLVHLAWEARPGRYRDDPVNRLWAEASVDLLKRARACGTGRTLGIGSCFEYGSQSGPCEERTSQCRPTTLYGQAKLATAEAYIAAGAAWGRLFVPFGPHEPEARLMPSLIRSLRAGQSFDCSHGGQLRDFVYVDDLARMIAAVLDSESRWRGQSRQRRGAQPARRDRACGRAPRGTASGQVRRHRCDRRRRRADHRRRCPPPP